MSKESKRYHLPRRGLTAAAARTVARWDKDDKATFFQLAPAEQHSALRHYWRRQHDEQSPAEHDAERSLGSLTDFLRSPLKRNASYHFALAGEGEYHWLLESQFRQGVGRVIQDMTGYEGFVLPDISHNTLNPELNVPEYSYSAIGLTVLNKVLTTNDEFVGSQYEFTKSYGLRAKSCPTYFTHLIHLA